MLQVVRDGAKIEFGRKSESAHAMLGSSRTHEELTPRAL